MRNTLKNSLMFIIMLFVTFALPFRVEAKQSNTAIWESAFDNEELISGDTIKITGATTFTPVENQNFEFYAENKITNFEYYIIDSIDSNGTIKYKKYDFTDSDKNVWYPNDSVIYDLSGYVYDETLETINYFNVCDINSRSNGFNSFREDYGYCLIVLPAVNGKVSRWRLDSKDYGDKKDIDVCKFVHRTWSNDFYYSSCDKTDTKYNSTPIGTYEYYTSYVYKFYEIPDEKPEVKFTCDSNKLSAGKSTKCKINLSYKYGLSNILFDIISDKLKISNIQVDDYWNADPALWTSKEIDNGYSINFAYNRRITNFNDDPLIATFDVTADKDIDDVSKSLRTSDIKYVDKTGDGIATAKSTSDEKSALDDIINNIINPSTFRNSYYLIIGIIIIGGICFIQLRSKKKNK